MPEQLHAAAVVVVSRHREEVCSNANIILYPEYKASPEKGGAFLLKEFEKKLNEPTDRNTTGNQKQA